MRPWWPPTRVLVLDLGHLGQRHLGQRISASLLAIPPLARPALQGVFDSEADLDMVPVEARSVTHHIFF